MKNLITNVKMRTIAFLLFLCFAVQVSGQVTINSTVTWDIGNPPPTGYENGITIIEHGHLTVDGITLEMYNTSFIILTGGYWWGGGSSLTLINGAVITGISANTWGGIRCEGDGTPQDEQFTSTGFPNYTVYNSVTDWEGTVNPDMPIVRIENSEIKNAITGVKSIGGGIIRARNSQFTNCQKGAVIDPYQSSTLNNTYFSINACYFMDCEFVWDDNYLMSTDLPYIGIEMTEVKGVNIGGTLFKNAMTSKLCPTKRGIGIKSLNAKFLVAHSGNTVIEDLFTNDDVTCQTNGYNGMPGATCTFEQLSMGIEFSMGLYGSTSFKVKNALFKTNYRGIAADASLNPAIWPLASIFNCTFESSREDLADIFDGECYTTAYRIVDVYLKSIRAELYQNSFNFDGVLIHHVTVDALGGRPGFIRANSFANSDAQTTSANDVIGVRAISSNPNVYVTCNTFTDMGIDIKIDPGATLVNPMSGVDGGPASNVFSSVYSNRYKIDNSSNPTVDYREWSTHDPELNSINLVTINPTEEETECELSCEFFANEVDFPLGVSNNFKRSSVKLYPNPNIGKFIIVSSTNNLVNLNVHNSLGQLVHSVSLTGSEIHEIDLSHLSEGVYHSVVTLENGEQQNLKFIISK